MFKVDVKDATVNVEIQPKIKLVYVIRLFNYHIEVDSLDELSEIGISSTIKAFAPLYNLMKNSLAQ